ncbi:transcription activator MSS11-like [Ischnura elegans]|uniref:transcription activator MSS11-like n=1 Tax=Ischnura elegans TaxID=197161 RepID=UPI001ED8BFBE|nr:transcription activator MSS11-like [Ischnura elegans]
MQHAEAQQALVGQHQQALADQAQQFQQAFAAQLQQQKQQPLHQQQQQNPQPLLPPQLPPPQQPPQLPPPQHDAEANVARLQATNQQEACRVAVKLPSFWPSKPSVWFAQAEVQCELANITREETKYNHVVSILDNHFAEEVEDISSNPPAQNRYEHLKNEPIRRLSLSEEKRVRQLLQAEELGDRQPSQFLRHMRSTLNGSFQIQDTLLRQIWLTRLPITVQAILQAQTTLPLDELAKIADRIVEVSPLPPPPALAVNAVASSTDTSAPAVYATTSSTDFSSLARRLGSLKKQLTALLSQLSDQHRHSRSRSRSRDYFPSRSRSPSRTYHPAYDASLCYYHRRFGNAARSQAPCSRARENSSGEQ